VFVIVELCQGDSGRNGLQRQEQDLERDPGRVPRGAGAGNDAVAFALPTVKTEPVERLLGAVAR